MPFVHGFSSLNVSSAGPDSCLLLSMCIAYADMGLFCLIQGDRREPDVFEMIITHLFFNEKAVLLQKNLRNYLPFELHITNER